MENKNELETAFNNLMRANSILARVVKDCSKRSALPSDFLELSCRKKAAKSEYNKFWSLPGAADFAKFKL